MKLKSVIHGAFVPRQFCPTVGITAVDVLAPIISNATECKDMILTELTQVYLSSFIECKNTAKYIVCMKTSVLTVRCIS